MSGHPVIEWVFGIAGRALLRFARGTKFAGTQSLPCRAGEVAPAQQATEGCWRFAHLTKEPQTFGTPPAALTRGHLPYNVGEALNSGERSEPPQGARGRSPPQ